MQPISTRRSIVLASVAGLNAWGQTRTPIPDRGPALGAPLVKEFVIAGHSDLEKTKALAEKEPSLVLAAWDWGGGDFETALGGAFHMGRRDIAEWLLQKGARLDLFAAAMLGRIDILKAALAAFPDSQRTLGPHKIPLIAHARKGGTEAAEVVAFLETVKA